jgi:hypothetical protein
MALEFHIRAIYREINEQLSIFWSNNSCVNIVAENARIKRFFEATSDSCAKNNSQEIKVNERHSVSME